VNERDPSNPSACVPDPGGAPPGHRGPSTSAPACQPGPSADTTRALGTGKSSDAASSGSGPASRSARGSSASSSGGSGSSSGGGGLNLSHTLGRIVGTVSGASHRKRQPTRTPSSSGGGSGGGPGNQTQALLHYLLAP